MNTLHKSQMNYIFPPERFYNKTKAGTLIALATGRYGRVEQK